eukprot:5233628-Pyramimonas_sp.AAC.1
MGEQRKLVKNTSCVLGELLCSLDPSWFFKPDTCRLGACHWRCLREVLGIAPSCFSRMSNAVVLEKLGPKPLSAIQNDRRTQLYRNSSSRNEISLLEQLVCDASGGLRNLVPERGRR